MPDQPTAVVLGPDLVALLQEMGLSWDEVRIYQYLLNAPAAISSVIVRETGHPRGRIYEALRRLAEKGLVREEPTHPIQFHPTPLSEILAKAHERLTRQLAAVRARQAATPTATTPGPLVPAFAPTRPRDVRVFSGRSSCQAEWTRMLVAAEKFFWLTGGERLAIRLAQMPKLLEAMVAALGRGVVVEVVLPKSPATAAALKSIAKELGPGAILEATVDEFGPLISCTTDHAAMEIISQPDDESIHRGDDVAIQVSSELFANANRQRSLRAEVSMEAKPAAAIYQWLGPNHGSDLFLEAVRKAQTDVMVLGPHQWSDYLASDWKRNATTYREAKARGVRFRGLTVRGKDDPKVLGRFAEVWDIRIVDWHPVWLTVIDGRELYQAFTHPSLGGQPQFRQSREPNEIKFYSTLFNGLWERGEPV